MGDNPVDYIYKNGFIERIKILNMDYVNIDKIYNDIKKLIMKKEKENTLLQQEQLNYSPQSIGWQDIENQIDENALIISNFHKTTPKLYQEYTQIVNGRKKVINFTKTAVQNEDVTNDKYLSAILDNFSQYVLIIYINKDELDMSSSSVCSLCGSTETNLNNNIVSCVCGLIMETSLSDDIVQSSRGNYKDLGNFIKQLNRYDGTLRLSDAILSDICEKLDVYFKRYSRPIGEEIRKMECDKNGRKENTSPQLMRQALRAIEMACYYDYTMSICVVYWGYKRRDISSVRDIVIQDYIRTQPLFLQIITEFPELRKSSLNTGFRLHKHLEARKHPCMMDEFRIVKTHDILVKHDRIWWVMCDATGIPFIPSV